MIEVGACARYIISLSETCQSKEGVGCDKEKLIHSLPQRYLHYGWQQWQLKVACPLPYIEVRQ